MATMIAACVAFVAVLLELGEAHFTLPDVESPTPAVVAELSHTLADASATARNPLAVLMLQLVLVVCVAQALGRFARALGQPPVIGELATGLLMGPSVVGHAFPKISRFMFPVASMGIAMSITAFPVLARMLDDRGLSATPLGTTALACAAVDDVTAWTLLAVVVVLATASSSSTFLWTLLLLAVFVLLMIRGARPLLARWLRCGPGLLRRERLGVVLAFVFASALATEAIGVHALFGAFLAGAVMPADHGLRQEVREGIESLCGTVLLPVFFAFTGLRTQVGLLNDTADWLVCGAVVATATAAKLLGAMAGARWTGLGWPEAFALGALMNTRGLMELVALNIGYDLGILSPAMFAILVIMALVTTAITCPLLNLAGILHARQLRVRAGGACS